MKKLLVALGLMLLLQGCRMIDGAVWDTYHVVGLIGDQTTKRKEKIERKDIMAEQDRLNVQYRRFIITMPDELK